MEKEIKRCLTCGKKGKLHKDIFDAWQCDKCEKVIDKKVKDLEELLT